MAQNIASLRSDLLEGRIPRLNQIPVESSTSQTVPLLPQMERTVSLMVEVFEGTKSRGAYAPPPSNAGDPSQRLFVRDALTNPEHIKFALKGCLAASLCYIIYTALDWNGISTAVVTCILTALTTIGASRQKQVLRFMGALVGGAISLVAQVFILPYIDSIYGFTVLFLAVTIVAAWIATSSPRLSYFGIQLALAFYIINLQDFAVQTALTPARDRIIGIMLGLVMMWLVFDQLWSAPTVVQMRKAFVSLFRLLAELAREPQASNPRVAIERSYSLRETINSSFNQIRGLADAVWFEFGPTREQDLALRSRIVGCQPQLRMLFVTRVSLLKYRLKLPGFELPEPVRLAQQEFDECLTKVLEEMADRLEGKAGEKAGCLETSLARLEEIVKTCSSATAQGALADHLQTFLPLLRRIEGLTVSLNHEIFLPANRT